VATLGGAWLFDLASVGVNVKGIQSSLADVKANGFAADLGATAIYPKEVMGSTLRGSFTLRNLGPGLKFIDQSDPLPREWRVGVAALQMWDKKLNASMDYGKAEDMDGSVYTGLEYWCLPMLALRAGYADAHTEGNGLRAGIGLRFKDVSFDYAFSSYGDLGLAHRYELTVRFGVIQPRLTPEERKLLRRAKIAMAERRYGEATELFDSLIQMEPNYMPVRRYVKSAMRGYEGQELSSSTPYKSLKTAQREHKEDFTETQDLESLLNMTDAAVAQKPGSKKESDTK
jgi:hypothetical protein